MSSEAQSRAAVDDYRVELESYEGPLDLLLYLVKRHEIDLNDIPIAKLTEQYLEHLQVIQEIDIERAGDFLVMAATLLEIKSQMLVPYVTIDDEEEGEEQQGVLGDTDPRFELVQQLLAYKRFKDAAMDLEDRLQDWQSRLPIKPARKRGRGEPDTPETIEFDLDDVDVHHLCDAFTRILESIGNPATHEVEYDDTPISLHEEDILDRLGRDGEAYTTRSGRATRAMTLQQIFVGRSGRGEMIGLFLALLELVRQRRVKVQQKQAEDEDHVGPVQRPDEAGSDIRIVLNADPTIDESDQDAVDRWRDPETGEIDYEWPSDEIRQQVERRRERRAERLAKIRRGEAVEEEDDVIDVDDQPVDEHDDEDDQPDDAAQPPSGSDHPPADPV